MLRSKFNKMGRQGIDDSNVTFVILVPRVTSVDGYIISESGIRKLGCHFFEDGGKFSASYHVCKDIGDCVMSICHNFASSACE